MKVYALMSQTKENNWTQFKLKFLSDFLVILVMNCWCWSMLVLWTAIGSLIALPLLLVWKIITGWEFVRVMHFFIWIYGKGCMLFFYPFVRFQIKNMQLDNMPAPGVIVFNHFSFFDTYLLSFMPVFDVYICLRSWPFKMIWYSFFMRMAQYLDIERLPWEQIVKRGCEIKRMNKYMAIFPEGHRSRTGTIGRFYSGAFRLAVELDVPIIPICLSGTQDLLPYYRWWMKPARVEMELLAPVYPDKYTGETAHIKMKKDVLEMMKETVAKLESQK